MPRFVPIIRTGVVCACVLFGIVLAYISYRIFWYPGEPQRLKQESDRRSLHGEPIKIYLDYRKAPAMLEIRIHQKHDAPDVRYGELTVKVFDEKGETIPFWNGSATSDWAMNDWGPGMHSAPVDSVGTVLWAVYYLQVAGGRHAASVDLEWSGAKEKFPVYASNHGFGYATDD
jgi:hypothetical protein